MFGDHSKVVHISRKGRHRPLSWSFVVASEEDIKSRSRGRAEVRTWSEELKRQDGEDEPEVETKAVDRQRPRQQLLMEVVLVTKHSMENLS